MSFEDAWDSLIDGDEDRPGGDGDKSGDDDGDDDGNGEDDGYSPLMESEDLKDSLELDDEAVAIVEGHCPGDAEVQSEKATGLAILPDVSHLKSSMRRQKSKEDKVMDRAVEEGGEQGLRLLTKVVVKRARQYKKIASNFLIERELLETRKRPRLVEATEQEIRGMQEKRLLAAQETSKHEAIAKILALERAKRRSEEDAAAAKRYSSWLQSHFAAAHAEKMESFIKAMSHTEKEAFRERMNNLKVAGEFKRKVTIDDPWEPTIAMQNFGILPDIHKHGTTAQERRVKVSRNLLSFITTSTSYKPPLGLPSPESAMKALLEACFLFQGQMFKGKYSPYQLLWGSHMCIEVAFVRAVLLASAWLGPDVMPVGHLPTCPPTSDATGI